MMTTYNKRRQSPPFARILSSYGVASGSGSDVGAVASFDLQDEPLASMIAPKLPVE